MNFFVDSTPLSFESFLEKSPELEGILTPELKGQELRLDGGQLIYVSDSDLELKINAKSELEYHKRYFFKNSIYKELIAKAVGLKKAKNKPKVLDATGGTLKDSLLLKSMGLDLIVCERSPISAALITNAISQNQLDIEFHYASCADKVYPADVAYYDPMYEHINSKSLAKKEMRIFRDVIGPDTDDLVVAQFLLKNYKRLVIKRSIKAPVLLDNPSMSFSGKSTRYDVYLS